jgi:hypothetical protein
MLSEVREKRAARIESRKERERMVGGIGRGSPAAPSSAASRSPSGRRKAPGLPEAPSPSPSINSTSSGKPRRRPPAPPGGGDITALALSSPQPSPKASNPAGFFSSPLRPAGGGGGGGGGAEAAIAARLNKIYDELDRDHDGSLTPREIILALRKNPALAKVLGLGSSVINEGQSRDKLMEYFHEIDVDQNDSISREEFLSFQKIARADILSDMANGDDTAAATTTTTTKTTNLTNLTPAEREGDAGPSAAAAAAAAAEQDAALVEKMNNTFMEVSYQERFNAEQDARDSVQAAREVARTADRFERDMKNRSERVLNDFAERAFDMSNQTRNIVRENGR